MFLSFKRHGEVFLSSWAEGWSKTAWTVLSDSFSPSLKKQDGVRESKSELRSQGSSKKELDS